MKHWRPQKILSLPIQHSLFGIRHSPFAIFFFFFLVLSLPCSHAQVYTDDEYTDPPFWRQALGGEVTGPPVAQVESIVVTTDGGNLKSYSTQGRPLWDYFAKGRLMPFASRSREGTSYICRTNGLLIAVNRSGRELWQQNLKTPLIYPVLTGWDGRLFVFTDRRITCMTASGYTLWSRNLDKKSVLAPAMDYTGAFILVQEDGEVLRFDAFGNSSSYYAGGPGRVGSPGGSTAQIPVAAVALDIEGYGYSILLLYEDRHLELIYPSLGYGESLRGKLDLSAPPLAAIAGSTAGERGEAAVLLRDGRITLISPGQRKILWTEAGHIRAGELPGKPDMSDFNLIFDERGIYVITKTGASGFTEDGRRLWTIRLRGAAALPSFGDDGILYSGGADWILYAYRLEDRIRAKQLLLYGEKPEGNYGTANPRPSSQADNYFRFSETEMESRFSEIRRAVRDGNIGNNEREYTAWLMEIAGSLLENPRTGNHPPVLVQYRVEAARLLAFMGSQETIPFLSDLFIKDSEVLVKAAAAEAIGNIGVDPDGLALRAFTDAVTPPFALSDENVLTAIANATGALCRFSGPPLSGDGIRILTMLSFSDKPPATRRQAERELRSLGRI